MPSLAIPPPPESERPFMIVTPETAPLTPELIVKMRKFGVPPAALRITVMLFAPGPSIVMSEVMSGNAVVRFIVPVTEKLIVSEPLLLPAAHSPAIAPEARLVLAAVIASRKVHNPSLIFATSVVLLTVIVLPAGVGKTPSAASAVPAKWFGRSLAMLAAVTRTNCGGVDRDANPTEAT